MSYLNIFRYGQFLSNPRRLSLTTTKIPNSKRKTNSQAWPVATSCSIMGAELSNKKKTTKLKKVKNNYFFQRAQILFNPRVWSFTNSGKRCHRGRLSQSLWGKHTIIVIFFDVAIELALFSMKVDSDCQYGCILSYLTRYIKSRTLFLSS